MKLFLIALLVMPVIVKAQQRQVEPRCVEEGGLNSTKLPMPDEVLGRDFSDLGNEMMKNNLGAVLMMPQLPVFNSGVDWPLNNSHRTNDRINATLLAVSALLIVGGTYAAFDEGLKSRTPVVLYSGAIVATGIVFLRVKWRDRKK